MDAATYPTLLRLRIPPAGANSDDSNASWKLPRLLELTTSPGRLTTGDGRHVSVGATVRRRRGASGSVCGWVCGGGACGGVCGGVLAAVSVAAGLAAGRLSAPAEGESRMSPAASDGCPLRKRLGTVTTALDVPEAV
ncbi:hypothetical protein NDU88_001881 [Pleurodeles waltl]|uniref:Uncharacterized protein n=1 Tax=Pleurodeles waltl TaxID=8319 RepID=A0AAV7LAS9_PLEWA|nr:hypothetical protein NDU88_001881 [Pleurodeles waltl]